MAASEAAVQQALALLFRRFRERKAGENDLVKVMSLTLGWSKPSDAQNLLYRGVEAGLLEKEGNAYRATFDPSDVEIPFGFKPDGALFEPAAEPADTGLSVPADAASAPEAPAAPDHARDEASEGEAAAGAGDADGANDADEGHDADDADDADDAGDADEAGQADDDPAPRTEPGASGGEEPASEPGPSPEQASFDDPDRPVVEALLDEIARHVEGGRTSAVAAVNAKQAALDDTVSLEVAALLVAESMGIDVRERAGEVLDGMRQAA